MLLPADFDEMETPTLSLEDTLVLEIWGDLLEKKQAAVPRDRFKSLYFGGKRHRFFSNAERAFSKTAWQLLGDRSLERLCLQSMTET